MSQWRHEAGANVNTESVDQHCPVKHSAAFCKKTPTDKLRVSDTFMEIAGMRHISAIFNMVSTLST
jgi:hypothetical protein